MNGGPGNPKLLSSMVLCVITALSIGSLRGQSNNPQQLFRDAVKAQQAGDYPRAIQEYRRFLSSHQNSPEAWANLGAALSHETRYKEAIVAYQAALKLEPGNADIETNEGLAFYKMGDFARAATVFHHVVQQNPQDNRAVLLLADSWNKSGQARRTAEMLQPRLAASPGDLDLNYLVGSAYLETGRKRDAIPLLEKVGAGGASADAWLLAGSALLDLGDYDRAKNDLDRAEQLNPALPKLHTLAGEVRDKLGDQAAAQVELKKALDQDSNDFRANLLLGAIFLKARDLAAAKPYLDKALSLDKTSVLALYEHAVLDTGTGQNDRAAQELEQVVSQQPRWQDAHRELAIVYYKLHRPADGLKERQIVDHLAAERQRQEAPPS